MYRYFLIFLMVSISLLVACDEVDEIDSEKVEAKVEGQDKGNPEEKEGVSDPEDIWTYYDDATWEEDFNGLISEIQKVVVTERAPSPDGNDDEVSAVGVKFLIENTTEDNLFSTFPDQAILVTSTGEQVDADGWNSDHIGGDIHEGVIKEGDVIFFLERGEADSIEWIKLEWNTYDETLSDAGDYDNYAKTHSVKLELK